MREEDLKHPVWPCCGVQWPQQDLAEVKVSMSTHAGGREGDLPSVSRAVSFLAGCDILVAWLLSSAK